MPKLNRGKGGWYVSLLDRFDKQAARALGLLNKIGVRLDEEEARKLVQSINAKANLMRPDVLQYRKPLKK